MHHPLKACRVQSVPPFGSTFSLTFSVTDLIEKGQCPPLKTNASAGLEADLWKDDIRSLNGLRVCVLSAFCVPGDAEDSDEPARQLSQKFSGRGDTRTGSCNSDMLLTCFLFKRHSKCSRSDWDVGLFLSQQLTSAAVICAPKLNE
ncbi:unnamed protein product [Pleuronectes platessa]|uniref:Uncharacterized protein n=1 Tax=Pleuronectes platessa TaxID=8262 RepID=A0A9N7ZDN0_PLEPL|nr:unnamed protein product [Pleuronectes platessa]